MKRLNGKKRLYSKKTTNQKYYMAVRSVVWSVTLQALGEANCKLLT